MNIWLYVDMNSLQRNSSVKRNQFWLLKSAAYTHLVKVKSSDFFVDALLTFSMNISSLNRSDWGKLFGLFEAHVYMYF